MANQITDNRTLVDNANAVGSWVGSTSPAASAEVTVGGGSIGEQVTNSRRWVMYDDGAARDWSSNVFSIWINCGVIGLLESKANGGLAIRFAGPSTSDYFEVYVAGNDEWPGVAVNGFVQFVVDIEDAHTNSDATGGTKPATNAIQHVGYSAITTSMTIVGDNMWVDEIRRLPDGNPGIIIEGRNAGTTDWTFADIFAQLPTSSGCIKDLNGAWQINTPIQWGINDTSTHGFTDTNQIVLFDDQEFIPTDYYFMRALGNSGGTTNVTFGSKTGTGNDASGSQGVIFSSPPTGVRYDVDFNDPNLDSIGLYGCSFIHGGDFLLDDAAVSCITNIYLDCTSALVSNSEQLKCAVIDANTADGVAFMTTDDIGDIVRCSFEFSDGHGVELTTPRVASQNSVGNTFTGYGLDATNDAGIYNNTAGAVTINVTETAAPTVRNGTSASTTLVVNPVDLDVTVIDNELKTPIEHAWVTVWCVAGGTPPFPSEDSVTITRSGNTATVTHTAHGLATNDEVRIDGKGDRLDLNGIHTITVTGVNEYTFTVTKDEEVEYHKTTITSPASTGRVTYSSVGFKGKGIRITAIQVTGTTLSQGAVHMEGYADAARNQTVMGSRRDGNSSGGARQHHPGLIIELQKEQDQNDLLEAEFIGFTDDGFVLDWTLTTSGYILHVEVFGGYGVKCHVGELQMNQGDAASYEKCPFKPNLLFGSTILKDIAGGDTNPRFGTGMCDSRLNQWGWAGHWGNFGGTTDQYHGFSTTAMCIGINGTAIYNEYKVTSMNDNGFTMEKEAGTSDDTWMIFLAISVRHAVVGNTTKSTGGAPATQTLPSFGFTPKALGVALTLATAASTATIDVSVTMGSYDGTNQGMIASSSEDGAHNSQMIQNTTEVAQVLDNLGVALANGVAQAITDDTPDIIWNPNNATAYLMGYWGIGVPTSGAAKTSSLVLINGLTNVNGIISDTRTYSADQNVEGTVKKGTSSPVYVPADIVGTVDSAAGLPVNTALVRDE